MTDEQIKQSAEDYINENTQGVVIDANIRNFLLDVYLAGAQSRDEEIWTLEGLLKISEQEIKQLRTPAWISFSFIIPQDHEKIFFRKKGDTMYYGWYDEKMQCFFTVAPDGTKYIINGVTHWMLIPKLL